jgi:hypothetical protein
MPCKLIIKREKLKVFLFDLSNVLEIQENVQTLAIQKIIEKLNLLYCIIYNKNMTFTNIPVIFLGKN